MNLGEKIKLLRTENNWTQPELAEKAGIEQSYLSKLENDKGTPSFDVINKVAQAFDMSGMDLIHTLSQSYIESKLSHLPEISAEYASIKIRREQSLKKRYFIATLVIVLGIGITITGNQDLLFPEMAYQYHSDGVVKDGENLFQFENTPLREIGETQDESKLRIRGNKTRFNRVSKIVVDKRVDYFIENVKKGQRVYIYHDNIKLTHKKNDFVEIFGVMLIASGLFLMISIFRFKN